MGKKKYIETPQTAQLRESVKKRLEFMKNCIYNLQYAIENENECPLNNLFSSAKALDEHAEQIKQEVRFARDQNYKQETGV